MNGDLEECALQSEERLASIEKRLFEMEQAVVHLANLFQGERLETRVRLSNQEKRLDRFANIGPVKFLRWARRKLSYSRFTANEKAGL